MSVAVCLEIGSKLTFAVALDWPGWSRSGKDQASALQALFEYAPRYAAALRSARLGFRLPPDTSAFVIAERLKGDTTTDFGAPGRVPGSDVRPVEEADLRRLQS